MGVDVDGGGPDVRISRYRNQVVPCVCTSSFKSLAQLLSLSQSLLALLRSTDCAQLGRLLRLIAHDARAYFVANEGEF